jgi:DNA-directed RNA polymerase specialized sigma24 family protein
MPHLGPPRHPPGGPAAVAAVLRELPERQREAIVLRY